MSAPEAVFAVVGYERGESPSHPLAPLAALVRRCFDVPPDIETNHLYGAWAGLTGTTRLLIAHREGKLRSRIPADDPRHKLCWTCLGAGHTSDDCPDGLGLNHS